MIKLLVLFTLAFLFVPTANGQQTTEITYQGQLINNGVPANGNFDFEFVLYVALSSGAQIGPILTKNNVVVAIKVSSIAAIGLDEGC